VGLTLAGFAVAQSVGVAPAWVALAGASVLGVRSLSRRHTSVVEIVRSVHVSFLVFVLALGVVVRAVMLAGMDRLMSAVLPSGSGLLTLLAIAAIAAVLANVVNNLPATLVLLPLVAHSGPVAVLAVLIGVNIGPQPDLRRFAVEPVVATRAPPARCRCRRRRIHPPRAVHCARITGAGGNRAVGQRAAIGFLDWRGASACRAARSGSDDRCQFLT